MSLLFDLILANDVPGVRALLTAGEVDVNRALRWAVSLGMIQMAQLFLAAGADLTFCDEAGWMVLLYAARKKNVPMVRMLLAAGADVNVCSRDGTTALLVAVYDANLELIHELLAAGAEVNSRDNAGWTPLMWGIVSRKTVDERVQILHTLRGAGADVNVRSDTGKTALMLAVGNPPLVDALLAAGADVNIRSHVGLTAFRMALNPVCHNIISALLPRVSYTDIQKVLDHVPPHVRAMLNKRLSRDHQLVFSFGSRVNTHKAIVPAYALRGMVMYLTGTDMARLAQTVPPREL